MMSVTKLGVSETDARSLIVLATKRGKVIDRRDENLCKEGNALARRRKSEGRGFECRCRHRIFSHKISFKVSLKDHLLWNLFII